MVMNTTASSCGADRSGRWRRGSSEANAKSIMSVLSLAAGKGVELMLSAQGEDAEVAVQSLSQLIEAGFAHP